jgi:serine/threonine protein phosphatase 1
VVCGLFKKTSKASAPSTRLRPMNVEIAPEQSFYAVGDLHGCFAEMCDALDRIEADKSAQGIEDAPVVFLGDYVDRGEYSADVLRKAYELNSLDPDTYVFLKGNHEQMMLDFIARPDDAGRRWLRYGGLQTLASFGVGRLGQSPSKERMYEACEELLDAMPDGMEAWLQALPLHWSSGNMHCVHAAMEPALPVTVQSQSVLLWGCPEFEKETRTDGNWIIHGHTIVDQPLVENGRISLDTGCYFSGNLTAARISKEGARVL